MKLFMFVLICIFVESMMSSTVMAEKNARIKILMGFFLSCLLRLLFKVICSNDFGIFFGV